MALQKISRVILSINKYTIIIKFSQDNYHINENLSRLNGVKRWDSFIFSIWPPQDWQSKSKSTILEGKKNIRDNKH